MFLMIKKSEAIHNYTQNKFKFSQYFSCLFDNKQQKSDESIKSCSNTLVNDSNMDPESQIKFLNQQVISMNKQINFLKKENDDLKVNVNNIKIVCVELCDILERTTYRQKIRHNYAKPLKSALKKPKITNKLDESGYPELIPNKASDSGYSELIPNKASDSGYPELIPNKASDSGYPELIPNKANAEAKTDKPESDLISDNSNSETIIKTSIDPHTKPINKITQYKSSHKKIKKKVKWGYVPPHKFKLPIY